MSRHLPPLGTRVHRQGRRRRGVGSGGPSGMWTSGGTKSRRLSTGEVLQEARESMSTYTSRVSYIYLLLARPAPRHARPARTQT